MRPRSGLGCSGRGIAEKACATPSTAKTINAVLGAFMAFLPKSPLPLTVGAEESEVLNLRVKGEFGKERKH